MKMKDQKSYTAKQASETMTSRAYKFQISSLRKAPLWALAAALALLLVLSSGPRSPQSLAAGPAPGAGAEKQSEITISYTYDDAGRLIQADYGNGQGLAYDYDAAGNLLRREVTGGGYALYLPLVLR